MTRLLLIMIGIGDRFATVGFRIIELLATENRELRYGYMTIRLVILPIR